MAPQLGKKNCCPPPPTLKILKPHDVPQRIDVKNCAVVEPPHPCDPPLPCDPFAKPLMACQKPYICWERIKNPAVPGEITKCKPGAFLNAKRCAKVEPPHPCDPLPICDPTKPKRNCDIPTLCEQRLKNRELPDGRKIVVPCRPPPDEPKPTPKAEECPK